MNTDIYQTANIVDTLVGSLMIFCSYKVAKQFYLLGYYGLSNFSFLSTGFYSLMILAQLNYLTQTYLRQIYLVAEIELLKNLEEVRITTVLQSKTNLMSFKGGAQGGNSVIAKISDVRYSDKDAPNSAILRIVVGDKRYYCHKNASLVQDFELLKAVLDPKVSKIQCFM